MSAQLVLALSEVISPLRREADTKSRGGVAKALAAVAASDTPTEITIRRTIDSLAVAKVVEETDGSMAIENNTGLLPVSDPAGNQTGPISVHTGDETVFVDRRDILGDGCLWEPYIAHSSGTIGVAVNSGHEWYRKTLSRCANDSVLVQAIEYLIFALAQAEANNTKIDLNETYREFRIEVGQNLRKLVKELPDSDLER